jgi:hypothetical protein
MTSLLTAIAVSPDFLGLPTQVRDGLVQLTDNAAAMLLLVAGFGLAFSVLALVGAFWTRNNALMARAQSGFAVSLSAMAVLYLAVGAANYTQRLLS